MVKREEKVTYLPSVLDLEEIQEQMQQTPQFKIEEDSLSDLSRKQKGEQTAKQRKAKNTVKR